jgi:hypothetical protein
LITKEGFGINDLRFGSFKPYLFSALVIPLAFAVIYGLTWLLGLGEPDWNLDALRELMASSGADVSTMPPPATLLTVLFFASLILGPTINRFFGFGEVLRLAGYLLPS